MHERTRTAFFFKYTWDQNDIYNTELEKLMSFSNFVPNSGASNKRVINSIGTSIIVTYLNAIFMHQSLLASLLQSLSVIKVEFHYS